mmetsp:Transcript_83221/g.165210  ORF Transcript_83221/g.165210 Transcript_83221/m.165210 type:complete len:742 (+) Transcript_83221:39-2264(+)
MPPQPTSARLQGALQKEYDVRLDDAMLDHLASDLEGDRLPSPESIVAQWSPFLCSIGLCLDDDDALGVCRRLLDRMQKESQSTAEAEAAAGQDSRAGTPAAVAGSGSPSGGQQEEPQKCREPELKSEEEQEREAKEELNAWLEKLRLVQYKEAAFSWCRKQGAAHLHEVLENWEDFAAQLKLKPLEKKRVEKDAANRAKADPTVQVTTPKATPWSTPKTPASPSHLPVPVQDPSPQPPASPVSGYRGKPGSPGGHFIGPKDDPQRYRILEELGQGATATVYRCLHGEVQRAVKTISLQKLRLQRDYERIADKLNREVSILFALRHPRIVSLFDVVEEPNKLHLVMELVEGGPEGVELFDYIVARGSFTESIARYVFLQIVEGLQYIHSKDIVYRDLKPENILVDEKASKRDEGLFEVKLSDFGHSKMIKDGYSTALTRVGTPQYWAPEVSDPVKAAKGYDQDVDLWSLGVVLYVMLIGSYPFDGVAERIEDQIRRAHISNFRSQVTGREATPQAQDLIQSLVMVNPQMRRSLEDCRTHPWVAKQGGTLDKVMTPFNDPHRKEERIRLQFLPTKQQVEELRRDLHLWMKKFKSHAQVKQIEGVAVVIANLDDQAMTGHSIEEARHELKQVVDHNVRRMMPSNQHASRPGPTLPTVHEKRTFRLLTHTLRVTREHGAGLDLNPEKGGMRIERVWEEPGQPGLQQQDLITKINEVSLRGTPETVEKIFGTHFCDGAQLAIKRDW